MGLTSAKPAWRKFEAARFDSDERRESALNFIIGLMIAVGSILGGYGALGGHLEVLYQPFEFLIIGGTALGIFIVANPLATIKDCGKAVVEAVTDKVPKPRDFLDVLSAMHALMRELRGKSRGEVEGHFDNPTESQIFKGFPRLLANRDLLTFICDYGRLIIIGNAKTHEIEALMDEEIETLAYDRYKPVHALQASRGRPSRAGHHRRRARHHPRDGRPRPIAGSSRRADRRRAGGHLHRHFSLLRRRRPGRVENQVGSPEAASPLHAGQAEPAGVHERRHAAGGGGIRAQDHSLEGTPDDRHRRERNHRRPFVPPAAEAAIKEAA